MAWPPDACGVSPAQLQSHGQLEQRGDKGGPTAAKNSAVPSAKDRLQKGHWGAGRVPSGPPQQSRCNGQLKAYAQVSVAACCIIAAG